MRFGGSDISRFLKTVCGILIIALIISGITIYFARKEKGIIYQFNPADAYVYTFHQEFFHLKYQKDPLKLVKLFSDGVSPLCLFGCYRNLDGEDLIDSLIRSPVESEGTQPKSRFTYLRSGGTISLEFDMDKGNTVEDKYPYVNRLIVELKDKERLDGISIKFYGYEFGQRTKKPLEVESTEGEFVFSQEFGQSSVFTLSKPHFVSEVTFEIEEDQENNLGLRDVSVYLERKKHKQTLSTIEEILRGKTDEKLKDLERKLNTAYSLDPYSPWTDYLLSEVYFRQGNYDIALTRIEKGIEKLDKYSDFMARSVSINDLLKRKARISGSLGSWSTAIKTMKKAVPEVDQKFLSDAYLNKYMETGEVNDLKSSFFHGCLAYQQTPRLVLTTLEKYRRNEAWLTEGIKYFKENVKKAAGGYELKGGRSLSSYMVNLSVSLLKLWQGREVSLEQAQKRLAIAEQGAVSAEKKALVAAIKVRVYLARGEENKADKAREKAIDFFSRYSTLYQNWIDFVERLD
ncbi:MAG: tetratricopeptide repeat protein [Candidatus Bipolaricaulota bacterium]